MDGVLRVLDKGAKKQYVKEGGISCPFCGSGSIEGESVEIDCGYAYQNISCANCGGEWTDEYRLSAVMVDF